MSSPGAHPPDAPGSCDVGSQSDRNTERPVTPPATPATQPPDNGGTPKTAKPSSQNLDPKHAEYDKKVREEMASFYSEVPYATFMKEFVQAASLTQDTLEPYKAATKDTNNPFTRLTNGVKKEADMYPIICEAFNGVVEKTTDEFVFKITGDFAESPTNDSRIDLGMYPTHGQARAAFDLNDAKKPDFARSAWAWLVAGVEVKHRHRHSAFHFEPNKKGFLRLTDEGNKSLSQIAKYAAQLMLRQHRTFVFIVYISQDMARLTRWDRTGCIVSTPFSLNEQSEHMLNFVHRLASMSRAEQGYDTSAVLATDAELKPFLEEYKSPNPYVTEWVKDIKDNVTFYPIYKVTCRIFKSKKYGQFLVGKHLVGSYSPTGRATKGYIAFNVESRRLCFLKDSWRANLDKIHPELEVYERLHKEGVSHIATVIAGGDVEEPSTANTEEPTLQRTVSQNYMNRLTKRPLERLHSRLVIAELGRALDTYDVSSTLIYVVSDALDGHCEAWEKAGVLHRDISNANILVVVDQDKTDEDEKVEGMLIDWDLCKYKEELGQGPTQHGRSGTWAFMSGVGLKYPYKPNDVADDLESIVHVICHNALQYHRHNKTVLLRTQEYSPENLKKANAKNQNLADHMFDMYYKSISQDGVHTGGEQKVMRATAGSPGFELIDKQSPLAMLIVDLYKLLKAHYAAIDFANFTRFGVDPPQESVPKEQKVTKPPKSLRPVTRDPGKERVTSAPHADQPAAVLEKVLDNHAAIRKAFRDAAVAIDSNVRELGGFELDKLQDQFFGMPTFVQGLAKGPSGTKRKSENSTDEQNESGRASKMANLGSESGIPLGSVQEEEEEEQQ